MNDPFFEYFKRERVNISQQLYGREAPRYKEYIHLPSVPLAPPAVLQDPLAELLSRRHSTREFSTEPMSMQTLSTLLYWSIGKIERGGKDVRPHPSGGAKYPIEMYVLALNVGELESGSYHYNAKEHKLEVLGTHTREKLQVDAQNLFGYPFVVGAAAFLCLTFVKSRSIQKYGAAAYKLGMLEAGHIGQNAYLASGALGIGCCGLGGGDGKEMYKLLGIDGGGEHFVYGLMLGRPADQV
jgi:SagB-type dehydrogenase family enzyme